MQKTWSNYNIVHVNTPKQLTFVVQTEVKNVNQKAKLTLVYFHANKCTESLNKNLVF